MIALLLTDVPFEQDIRELFMAFYPGESYVYEDLPEARIRFSAEASGSCPDSASGDCPVKETRETGAAPEKAPEADPADDDMDVFDL